MKFLDLIRTANSNIWSAKLRTTLTLLAIIIGTLALSLSNSLGTGASNYLEDQVARYNIDAGFIITKGELTISGGGGLFSPQEYRGEQTEIGVQILRDDDLEKLQTIAGIDKLYPESAVSRGIEYIGYQDKKFNGETVVYSPEGQEAFSLVAGSLDDIDAKNGIVLGNGWLESFGLGTAEEALGTQIQIVAVNDAREERTIDIEVVGILASSLFDNASYVISRNLSEELVAFNTPEEVAAVGAGYIFIEAYTDPSFTEEQVQAVRDEVEQDERFDTTTIGEAAGQITSVINGIRQGLLGFSLIAILASMFGVVNTLLMSVYERTRELGLMKSLGMSKGKVFMMLAIEAAVIGFWGSVLGVAISFASATGLNAVGQATLLKDIDGFTPFVMSLDSIVIIVTVITAVSVVAGLLPARKAMRLDPIEALRYE